MSKNDLDIDKMLVGSPDSDEIVVNEFTESSAQSFRDSLMTASEEDPQKPLIVYIDSPGGYVDSLAKMIETMDEVPNPIITVAMGKAMSCGAILLSHGDIRFCGKHSRIMIHEISGGAIGDVHDVGVDADEMKRLNKHFLNLFAKNCNIKGGYDGLRKMIKDKDGRDIYLSAQEAKAFGVVDGIGIPRVKEVLTYHIDIVPEKPKLRYDQKKPKAKKSETKI